MNFLRIKVDLHIHSNNSPDSRLSIKDIIDYYYGNGFKAIAITDHETMSGIEKARKMCVEKGLDILIIPGVEVETPNGEIVVLMPIEVEEIPHEIMELIEFSKKMNGLTFAPHPFAQTRNSLKEKLFEIKEIDAIEVLNGRINWMWNEEALNAAKILGKPGIANSDAHSKLDLGMAYTIIDVEDVSIDGVFSAIKKNKIVKIVGRKVW